MSRWWLRAAVSVGAAVLLLSFVPAERVWGQIRDVRPWVWLAGTLVFVTGHAVNALKLRLLIGPSAASAASCIQAQFAGIAANLGLPGAAGGDVVRAAYLVPSAGMPRIAIAAIADRLVDTLVLLSLAGTAVWVAGLPPGVARPSRLSSWWLVVPLFLAAGAVAAARRLRRGPRRERVRAAAAALLARPGAVALAFAAGASVQSTFVLTNVWLASEVGIQTALAPWFLAWTAAKLGALLPISLGGIGVREAALVSLMAAYGAPPDAVLATGILWEAALIAGSLGGFLVTQLARR